LESAALFLSGQGARAGYLAGIDQAIISISNFLATIILARNVSPTELGVYGVGFIALRLVRSVQEGIIVQPLNVFGAALDRTNFGSYATSTALIQIGLALASSLSVALGGLILIAFGNDTAGPALFSLWFVFLWWQIQEFLRRVFYTRSKVNYAVLNSTIANAFRLGLMVWWASRDMLSGAAGLYAIGWGSLVAILPSLWLTRSYWTRHIANMKDTWNLNWHFGRWIMGGSIANWVAVEFYPILTAGLISFAAAGAYRAIQNLVAPVHMILRATDTFFTPRAARAYQKQGNRALDRTMRHMYLASGLPILFLLVFAVIFAEPLLQLLYGDTYVTYSNGILLMAFFYLALYAYWPLQSILKATQRSRPIFIANVAAIVTMFTIGIWAVQNYGVYGTIAGQMLNALVVNLILWGTLLRRPLQPDS
jgi:O-antigen/teichoic acid export membrane protein